MKYSNQALGRVVSARRKKLKLTQEELGVAAGYGAGAGVSISRIEAGATRPTDERLKGIAAELGLSVTDLAELAAQSNERNDSPKDENVQQAARRLQKEVEEREKGIDRAVAAFDEQSSAAHEQFFKPFSNVAEEVTGAPEQDPFQPAMSEVAALKSPGRWSSTDVERLVNSSDVATSALYRLASLPATPVAAAVPALSKLIGPLRGLGGVVGGAAMLMAIGGLTWATLRSNKQRDEARAKIQEADTLLEARRPAFIAVCNLLTETADLLEYIAVHAGHKHERWARTLPSPPIEWTSLSNTQQEDYQRLHQVALSYALLHTTDFQAMITSTGEDLQKMNEEATNLLTAATEIVHAQV